MSKNDVVTTVLTGLVSSTLGPIVAVAEMVIDGKPSPEARDALIKSSVGDVFSDAVSDSIKSSR